MPIDRVQYCREWYKKNKANHLENMKKKTFCKECDKNITTCYLVKHNKSKIHLRNASKQKENPVSDNITENNKINPKISKYLEKIRKCMNE